jgi:hypothetical protein
VPQEGAAADDAVCPAAGPPAETTVRGHEPVGGAQLCCLTGDSVVGGLAALEDNDRLDALALGPGPDELDELVSREVRPLRAADVLRVDEDRDQIRQPAALRSRG